MLLKIKYFFMKTRLINKCWPVIAMATVKHVLQVAPSFLSWWPQGRIQASNSTSVKLCYKSTILVHGHVRIFLNFVTFPLIVLIKIAQVIENISFEIRFVINNKTAIKEREQLLYAWLDYVISESTFRLMEEYI